MRGARALLPAGLRGARTSVRWIEGSAGTLARRVKRSLTAGRSAHAPFSKAGEGGKGEWLGVRGEGFRRERGHSCPQVWKVVRTLRVRCLGISEAAHGMCGPPSEVGRAVPSPPGSGRARGGPRAPPLSVTRRRGSLPGSSCSGRGCRWRPRGRRRSRPPPGF